MKNLNPLHLWRVPLHGDMGDAFNGAFHMPYKGRHMKKARAWLHVIASSGGGWDHISVSVTRELRLPTWAEMAWVKDHFFAAEECVMQLHPPASQYVNNGEVLHLWRPQDEAIPLPPAWMVGILGASPEQVAALLSQTSPMDRAVYPAQR
jgi:hypothetical protein